MSRLKRFLREFANSPPELHALVIGTACALLVVATQKLEYAVMLWVALTGGRKLKGHLADARKELAYTIGAFAVIYGLTVGVRYIP